MTIDREVGFCWSVLERWISALRQSQGLITLDFSFLENDWSAYHIDFHLSNK